MQEKKNQQQGEELAVVISEKKEVVAKNEALINFIKNDLQKNATQQPEEGGSFSSPQKTLMQQLQMLQYENE